MKKLFKRLFPDQEMREYRKMHRRHRKELIKLAKETREWDWSWLHEMVIMQIRHMHEYYVADNDVWQADEKRFKVIEQLKYVLDLNSEIERMVYDDNGVKYIHENGVCTAIYPDDYKERVGKYYDKEHKLYQELYSSIGKNLQWWWD